jgi:MoxR-like ATPase
MTYPLSDLFFVMATQNPIDQEGTYPLPEAQLDRFLLKVNIDYPVVSSEVKIMRQVRQEALGDSQALEIPAALPLPQQIIFSVRQQILSLHMADPVEEYIAQLVNATRNPQAYSADLEHWIQYGASPRATLAFDRCARALAWLDNRDYVSPEDVQQLAHEVLRHRLLLNYQAEIDGVNTDAVIDELLLRVPVA